MFFGYNTIFLCTRLFTCATCLCALVHVFGEFLRIKYIVFTMKNMRLMKFFSLLLLPSGRLWLALFALIARFFVNWKSVFQLRVLLRQELLPVQVWLYENFRPLILLFEPLFTPNFFPIFSVNFLRLLI